MSRLGSSKLVEAINMSKRHLFSQAIILVLILVPLALCLAGCARLLAA